MMLYPAMNKLTGYIPNRYMLVDVVARRARQIADEAGGDWRASDGEARHPGHPGSGGRQAGRQKHGPDH